MEIVPHIDFINLKMYILFDIKVCIDNRTKVIGVYMLPNNGVKESFGLFRIVVTQN